MTHTTMNGNSAASDGGGIYLYNYSQNILTMTNTVIVSNTSPLGGNCVIAANGGGSSIVDGGSNWDGDGSCIVGLTGDPDLGPLADNGGGLLTHKPNAGSGLIDAGSCPAGVDQRGANRPYDVAGAPNLDNGCDIGAVEVILATSATCGGSPLSGPYGFPFDNGDQITITVGMDNGLDCLTVEKMFSSHPTATTPIQTGYWWQISGNVTSGVNVSITLPYTAADATTRVCKWPGGLGGAGWDCGDGTNTTFDGNWVTRSGITGFSDWGVGQAAGPTAVAMRSSEMVADNGRLVIWVALGLLLVSGLAVTAVRRSKV